MNIRKKHIKRVVIIGKRDDRPKAVKYLDEHGYTLKSSGPIPVSRHRMDFSRFRLVGEKDEKEI